VAPGAGAAGADKSVADIAGPSAGAHGAAPADAGSSAACGLPELASVYWRARVCERSLVRSGRLWTLTTVAHTVPFIAAAVLLGALQPITLPVSLVLLAHAWIIPELYAVRGANVIRARPPMGADAERRLLGLLGDLVAHGPRELLTRTGLVLERGELGVWLVGEAGAVLVRPGGRRVHCYCVKAIQPELPGGDRTAHLLLALRADEAGFATVANLSFSGACWRLRRRVSAPARQALAGAVRLARPSHQRTASGG